MQAKSEVKSSEIWNMSYCSNELLNPTSLVSCYVFSDMS